MVDEARESNYIQTKRNPNWWFGKSIGKPDMPYFDGARVTVIPENSVKLANLKAGKIDEATYRKLTDILPDSEATWLGLGHALVLQERYAEALESLNRALDK